MRTRVFSFILGSLLVAGSATYASTISVGQGAFTNAPSITFESIAWGEAIASQYASQGVTFGNLWGDARDVVFFTDAGSVVAANFGIGVLDGVTPVTMGFSTPYDMVGFELFSNGFTTVNVVGVDGQTNTFNIYAYVPPIRNNRGQIVVQAKGVFVGFENPTGIGSISIGPSAGNNSFIIDNVILQAPTGVPEPGTLGLLGVALLGLAFSARRRLSR